jgi:Flp pilus assembly protein TadD
MRVYNFTDSSRFTGAKVLSIHKYMENVLRGDDPSSLGEAIRQSVATEPDNALTYTLAGEILLKTGRKNEAKNELEQALQLFPNSERAKQDMIAAMQGIHSSQ